MDLFHEIALYFGPDGGTRRIVMLGCVLLGVSSGVLGTFAFLRRQSLLGDAMAHAALPGICVAFLIFQVKNPLYFLIGATCSGLLGAWLVSVITRHSRIKNDTAIGLVLSVFFGLGVVLLTVIQQQKIANQAGLENFLFGQAAFLLRQDLYTIAGMCVLLIFFVFLFFKEFKILSFDPGFGASLGLPMRKLELLLTGLIVISVMIGLQAVGVILMAALLIIPAAAARQWTDRLGLMIVIAAIIGAVSGILGAFVSTIFSKMPTGPVMVLAASTVLLFSLFFAPKRGLIYSWRRLYANRRKVETENLLKAFYMIGERAGLDPQKDTCSISRLLKALPWSVSKMEWACQRLVTTGELQVVSGGWLLTGKGANRAKQIVRNHRLWELYLSRQADIAIDHVHRDAEEMEHILSPELVRQLEEILEHPELDPHGKPIPTPAPLNEVEQVLESSAEEGDEEVEGAEESVTQDEEALENSGESE